MNAGRWRAAGHAARDPRPRARRRAHPCPDEAEHRQDHDHDQHPWQQRDQIRPVGQDQLLEELEEGVDQIGHGVSRLCARIERYSSRDPRSRTANEKAIAMPRKTRNVAPARSIFIGFALHVPVDDADDDEDQAEDQGVAPDEHRAASTSGSTGSRKGRSRRCRRSASRR